MRWDYFKARGFGPFREEVELDLTKLGDARLVAVVGPNGAGKSTLLELGIPGAIDRTTPTRGSLQDLATRSDAFLETRLANGSNWTIRHLVDGVSGKGEAVVLKDGVPILPDTKLKSFDRWRDEALPPSRVLFASTFAAQGASGFLDASRTDRVAIVLRLVEAEELEQLAKRARERAASALSELEVLAARVADERARVGDVATLEASLAEARTRVQTAREEVARVSALRQELAELQAAYLAELERVEAHNLARAAVSSDHAQALTRLSDVEGRVANNRAVMGQADAIRAAVTRLEAVKARLVEVDTEAQAHLAESKLAEAAGVVETKAARTEAQRAADARRQLAELPRCEELAGEVDARRKRVEAGRRLVTLCEQTIEELSGKSIAGAEERITALRGGLDAIASTSSSRRNTDPSPTELWTIAQGALDADDLVVEEAAILPARLHAERQTLATARKHLPGVERDLAEAEQAAAKLGLLRGLDDVAVAAEAAAKAAEERAEQARRTAAAALALFDALTVERAALGGEVSGLVPLVGKADPLTRAEARLAELEPQLADAAAEVQRLEAKLADHHEAQAPAPPPASPAFDPDEATARIDGLVHRVASLEAQLLGARAGAGRVTELEERRAVVELDLGDWNRLASDLGKDGIQAMEVDAAGPELTDLTNDLLRTCHGTRFTVRIDTQRASSDGKRLLEGCDVNVIDAQEGREGKGSTFSGGERVILGEALSLALAMFACQRTGDVENTLVRDESAAAMDEENAAVYVAMLRRAAELVRARVLVVSHTPSVWSLCDARINVGERGVEIVA